ncbi:Bax inhibitor-1 family protein [Bacillus spongiae]|uniref:Bax inhibitor-1 family protein n=1 Tax=Bacillus spongiae TaxID=2683610 RepID=A0ABU8HKD7_9BACI
MITIFIVLLVSAFVKRKSSGPFGFRMKYSTLYLFTFIMGIGIYPSVGYFLSSGGAELVMLAFIVTSILFGSLFLFSYRSTFLGPMLFSALLALIIISIFGIFIGGEVMHLTVAYISVVIFLAYVLYDVSLMKQYLTDGQDVPSAVFNLYLDFINLFLDLLRILYSFSNDNSSINVNTYSKKARFSWNLAFFKAICRT